MSYKLDAFNNDTWRRCLKSMIASWEKSGLIISDRFKLVDNELEKHRATNCGLYIEFEREEDYVRFLLKWS